MRILIIGGTGSISTYVTEALSSRGDEITIVSRANNPVPAGYRRIVANRDEPEEFAKAIAQWEGDVSIDFICFRPEHAENTYRAVNGRVKQHIFISTAAVYDKSSPSCIPLTEDSPFGARHWDYAQRKLECERFYNERHAEGFPVTIVRPSHTLGIGKIPAPVMGRAYTLAQRILEGKPIVLPDDGQTLWTLTASWDFAKGVAGLVGNEKAIGEIFHITHDEVLTWNCIMQELGFALGKEPKLAYLPREVICEIDPSQTGNLLDDKASHTVFDNSKIKRFVPEFECRTSFREFIRLTVDWYNEDPKRKVIDQSANEMMDRLAARASH